jgi:hypothetical protein
MKRGSTHFLRFVIFLLAVVALAFFVFALPSIWRGGSVEFPGASRALFLMMVGMYAAAVPFLVALWQAIKLLGYIDRNKAFSDQSVQALRNIKRCAIVITVLAMGCVPCLFPIAQADDAPGLLVAGVVVASAPIVIAVFAALLQVLLQSAIEIKSENDLTV